MELKVWVEGIQRIVCGVTAATTCHDVVYALAHATGKTGRFTLAERWRNNERLLSPQEHPLTVLAKWGEYSSDVQFILKQTGENSKSPTPGALQLDAKSTSGTRTPDFLNNFSPGNAGHGKAGVTALNGGIKSNPGDIKKSLTFSGGQNSGDLPFRDVDRGFVGNRSDAPQPVTSPTLNDTTSKESPPKSGSGDLVTVNLHISARKSKNHSPSVTNVAKSVVQRSPAESSSSPGHVPHHHQKPPPYLDPPSYIRPNTKGSDVHWNWKENSFSPPKNTTDNFNGGNTPSPGGLGNSGGVSRQSFNLGMPKSRRNLLSEFNRHDLEEEFTEDAVPKAEISLSHKLSPGLRSTVPTKKTRERRTKIPNSDQDIHYRELLRLVNLQRERLESQNTELTHFDAEIGYWEEKQRENQRQIQNIEKEVCRLEFSGKDTDEEVARLDKHHMENELEIGHQQEKTLAYELTLLRSKLANCETELLQCKNKMRTLVDEIADEKHWRLQDEKEREEREFQMVREIEDLHKLIKEKIRDYDTKVESTEKLDKEVRKLEMAITEKKKQVEDLIREMKAANLESLSFTPNEEIHNLLEGSSHKGPGSGRKIVGSPRQLENAVPTSKNPHGVWV